METKIYKTVLMPIQVPIGNYCWEKYVCTHFDNQFGPVCDYHLGDLKCDKNGHVLKPEKCLLLEEYNG